MADEIIELRYHPKNDPIPEGWIKTGHLHETHHGKYSILIKRVVDENKKTD